MADYKSLLSKLSEWLRIINTAIVGITVFEAILVVIIGVASNNINSTVFQWILGLSVLIYLFILSVRTFYVTKFPGSIVEELSAKKELEELKDTSSRQIAFNRYIADSINLLNSQTCALEVGETNNHLCESGMKSGLEKLLKPVISHTGFIIDSTESDFTVG
ncbi:hypothetical protein, partial [Hymenobacter roseosalivarius]|uniref:hypothetical protein n=1 Tax=Hymenobacter roseosalivarius TaxID=89967 RepID=UPI00190EFAC4